MKKTLFFIAFISMVSIGKAQTAYIVNGMDNTVSVINVVTNTVVATIPVGNNSWSAAASSDGRKVYIASGGTRMSVINTLTNTVSDTILLGFGVSSICVSPDGSKIYAVTDHVVSVIDTVTKVVTATISVGPSSIGISVSPDGRKVYVTSEIDNTVTVINTATNSVSGTIPVGLTPYGVTVSPDGSRVYVTNLGDNTVNVIDTVTNTAIDTIAVGAYPNGISLSPDGSKAYVANNGGSSVSVINTSTSTVTNTIPVGFQPHAVSVSPDGSKVYVTNSGDNTVSVINSATNTVSATIPVGNNPGSFGNFISTCIPPPTICIVKTDSPSYFRYNVICWDKTPYTNVDSFIVYRMDILSSSYLRIGAVSANDLSEFKDTAFSIGGPNGGNPRYASWLYKLALRDTFGHIGAKGPYHQTMFVQQNSSNFSWNAYTIDAVQANPVTGYSFLRDDNNTGNWHVLVNTAGLSSTDPDYLSYPNGNWRIDALGFNCTSTVKTTDTRSHSNTIKLVPVGIENVELNNELIIIYPNPAHSMLYIDNISNDATLSVYDYCGKLVMNSSATKTLDISRLSNGVYCLKVTDGKGVGVKRFVKE